MVNYSSVFFLAYYEYVRKNIPMVIVFVSLAILFQPLAKISLVKQVWHIVDVVNTIYYI
jgi:hypothetical protein